LPSTKFRVWAIIVSIANISTFIISFIYLLHFSKLFF
jgi:hypothetical protein